MQRPAVARKREIKMMRKYLLTLLGLVSIAANAADDVVKTIDASANGAVVISNVAGSVEVRGWSRNEVRVDAELGNDVEELIFERDGDEIVIKVSIKRHNARRVSSNLVISVPKASSLEINNVSADIDVRGVFGEQQLEAVSGDIETETFAEDIDINTVSGDIEITGEKQDTRVRLGSVSGDINIDDLSGEIDTETVSGDIEIENGAFTRVIVNTVNGSINFNGQLLSGGRLEAETINGSVNIDFTGDLSARIDVQTFNGEIDNCFGPRPDKTSRYIPGQELRFTVGGGDGRVSIQTLNGDISLCDD